MRNVEQTTLLIHGGLWEDQMDARRFWVLPGIADGLVDAGHAVLLPDRRVRAADWEAELEHLLPRVPEGPLNLIAASSGCAVGVLLALALPGRFTRMVLLNPATGSVPELDRSTERRLAAQGAPARTVEALLNGGVLSGVADRQLRALRMPVAVVPSVPEDTWHRRETVDAVLGLLPHSTELGSCPPPPRPEFRPRLDGFLREVTAFTAV